MRTPRIAPDPRPASRHRVSIVIPFYNEEENVRPLMEGIDEGLAEFTHPWELIVVDDGSTDRTVERLSEERRLRGGHIRVIELQRNFGQAAAMQSGIDAACGEVVVTLDGDLQNDPVDIPRMVKHLLVHDLDLLVGWRRNRRDGFWLRRLPSWFANLLISRVTGIKLHDYGCSLKVYRASVVRTMRLYGEMHRFIPAWLAINSSPSRIAEQPVRHHRRRFGESKYDLGRVQGTTLDLLSIYFFMRFRANPARFFGGIGLAFLFVGLVTLGYLFWVKFFLDQPIADRPLLLAGAISIVVALQFLTTGILSEFIARIYYESSDSKPYMIRRQDPPPDEELSGWRLPKPQPLAIASG